jgi:Raf kinase inhibitor-like YbhB/YbcL family protein
MPGGTRQRRRVAAAAAVVVLLALSAAACGDDGRALRDPAPDQTTTSAAPTTSSTGDSAGSVLGDGSTSSTEPMRLSSPAFADGADIPADYTCRGADRSLPLSWTGVPAGTVELAVVMRDIDPEAEGFVHWVVAGMAPTVGGLAEATTPPGVEAENDFGRPGWAGPCPPSGTHDYEIRLYALAEPSGVTAGMPGEEAARAVESRTSYATSVLSGSAAATNP